MDITTLKQGDRIKINTWHGVVEARVWVVNADAVLAYSEYDYHNASRGKLFPRPVAIQAEAIIEAESEESAHE